MTQPAPAPAPQPDQSFTVDAQRVMDRLGSRIGQLEVELAQAQDVIRQLMTAGEVPQPAPES